MIYLPDTNAWIRLLNPGENLVKDRFLAADDLRRKWDIKNDKKIVLLMLFYLNLRLIQKTL